MKLNQLHDFVDRMKLNKEYNMLKKDGMKVNTR
jgi:hypothetical protein